MDAPSEVAQRQVDIPAGSVRLAGAISIPQDPLGVVAFAHGSGSSRHSPRNRQVAQRLRQGGLATLLMDLLTEDEELEDRRTGELRFDIALLASRLIAAVDWLGDQDYTRQLPIGCFGASTGAAATLIAAARRPGRVRAVVSRGGRPDLAGPALAEVKAPTLLIVGGADRVVADLNGQARRQMSCPAQLEIVKGAGHLFEEPGALEEVAELAQNWFADWLRGAPSSESVSE
jgi:putative phosphoribosyl transferase